MSTLSDGDGPSKEEPTGKRRTNARRRNKRGGHPKGNAFKSSSSDAPDQPARSASGGTGVVKDGSGKNSGRAADASHQSGRTGVAPAHVSNGPPERNKSNKKRRGKRRKPSSDHDASLRHMRAPLQRQADVTFKDNSEKRKQVSGNSAKPFSKGSNNKWRRHKNSDATLYAALDLGTNNCRLLIAMPQEPGRFRVVDGFSRIVRLGEGMVQTGELSQAAMDRAVDALKICAGKLKNRRVRRQKLIATEACRQAANGEAFLKRVKEEAGIELEIASRETEAKLAAEGCGALIDRKADAAVLFDIGGGSSELILMDKSTSQKRLIADRIKAWTSLPLGVVTLAERFGGKNVTAESFEDMVSEVMAHIDAFEGKSVLDKTWRNGRVHLLGTSGTVTTLAGIHLELDRYDRQRVDGLWLHSADIDRVIKQLLNMSYDERASNPCVGVERADLVLAGCAILEAIRRVWPASRLRVADRGLREGLLTQMMSRDGAWIKRKKTRWNNKRSENQRRAENRK